MLLRYTIDNETEIAEITRMYHIGDTGYFVRTDNVKIGLPDINKKDWLRLTSDMFCDGRLSLDSIESKDIFIDS